ncbi:MAG TPA: hypothetical protein VFW96_00765, partial [Thermomicrobiales bacterium]|nr:hypothetical protein [Thermomicrobiales bacterium]
MAGRGGLARQGGRRGSAWATVCLLAVLLLGACGAPEEKTALVAAAEPSPTPIPTATPRPTATATPSPTATRPPSPTAPPTRAVPSPTATTAARPTAAPADGSYAADFSQWYVGETAGKYRTDYDQAADAYHLTIIENDYNVSVYAPEDRTFTDFVLEVDARRAAGPDAGGYGLVFRRQPRGNDAASVRYIFYVQPEGHFGLYLVRPDGSEQTLQAPTPSAAIKVGNAT